MDEPDGTSERQRSSDRRDTIAAELFRACLSRHVRGSRWSTAATAEVNTTRGFLSEYCYG